MDWNLVNLGRLGFSTGLFCFIRLFRVSALVYCSVGTGGSVLMDFVVSYFLVFRIIYTGRSCPVNTNCIKT